MFVRLKVGQRKRSLIAWQQNTHQSLTQGAIASRLRTHVCPKCNLVIDRDENAALNILVKGLNQAGMAIKRTLGHKETNTLGDRPTSVL
jgi:transposase